ncbi:MAG TPA: SPOR domain-containing protein [Methylomirabilota bacterium]|nr:SPOR domain-containing protein [Methylomirabilota bacterium]
MSPDRDEPIEEQEPEPYEDVPPRSIFAATWFRVVLVMIVVGVIGAVAVPYVLDWMNPPPPSRAVAKAPASPLVPAPATPALDRPADDKPPADKDKRDPALIPAPLAPAPPAATAPPTAVPARPEKPAPAPAAKPAPSAKASPTPVPAPPDAKGKTAAVTTETPARPPAPAREDAKSATATKPTAPRRAAAKATTPAEPAVSGPFWVQVGAFKDEGAAKRLAAKLRDDNFKVEESLRRAAGAAPAGAAPAKTSASAPGSDHYDVFVSGASVEDLSKRLSGKGLAAETSGSGVIVRPSLPLRDAVALSKELAVDGFKVQVRRTGGPVTAAPPPPAAEAGGPPLHRVRVGVFPDRAAAVAAVRELEAKGYKPFIARGDQ